MSKIARVAQKIFGSTATAGQIAQIGSLASGTPLLTTNLTTMQALTNYLNGWFDCVVGSNSPAIEDMNGLCYLFAYQLAYGFQAGVAEWDATTTYYEGSLINSNGFMYASAIDTNLNHAITDRTKWLPAVVQYDVICGAGVGCTHATLAAALADSALTDNISVYLKDSATLAATIASSTKAGWRIYGGPGVTLTAGVATTAFNITAARWVFNSVRFSGFTTGILFGVGGNYGRVVNCNFASCTTDVDDTAVAGTTAPSISGTIDE